MKTRILSLVLVLALLITICPLIWLSVAAMKPSSAIVLHPNELSMNEWSFNNFVRVFSETQFLKGVLNSLIVAVPVTIIVIVLSFILAYLCVHRHMRGNASIERFSILAYAFPPVLFALPLFSLFSKINAVDTLWALALSHILFLLPFAYWLLLARMKEISTNVEELLILDGADTLDLLRHVWFPQLRMHLLATGILVFTVSMNDYALARYLFVGREGTLPLILQGIFEQSYKDWGLMSAAAIMALLSLSVPAALMSWYSGENYEGGQRG